MLVNTQRKSLHLSAGVMSCFILPQNGVAESANVYGSSGNSSPQLDSRSAGVGDVAKRPKNLQVTAIPGGYAAKICRENGDVDGGSLPCTPEPESHDDVDSCSAADELLESITRELISTFFTDFVGHTEPRFYDSKALSTMKRVVDGVLEKHRYAYNGMINKLSLDDRAGDMGFVSAVAKSLFKDGTTNWGRIASLVAFGAVVCQHLKEKGRENNVELVGQEISTYLLSHQRDWLVKNNSWDGFVEFFRVSDPEKTVRNTLLGLAGFAGIGATLALLIR
ncbi:induced myeloid leukemia cell differentiation protein Mcl-1b [Paralichthys olivaceus]|uniref:induced myeloid leukemia cell differentiation protein Mcl-1b n=1 Tax=Paralichthys olivaceus TaxID=8255 RepID=UPI00097DEBFE|nr:PREDICTED: induced myeloid leukemia cell differentiation protein Mcl-1 homolog [Paralichthys olivaceus]